MLILIVKSFGSTNKGVTEFIISTLAPKERSCDPFKSTSMFREWTIKRHSQD